jgi:hypothetical protein
MPQKFLLFILLSLSLLISGCVRSAPIMPTPLGVDPLEDFIGAPTLIAEPLSTNPFSETDTPDPLATNTPFIVTPTEEDPETPTPAESPTNTSPPQPTATETQAPTPSFPPFDPEIAYGAPRFDAAFLSAPNWFTNSGDLPNDSNIRLEIPEEGTMVVTGKNAEFRTWWFSSATITDVYTEMEVQSGDTCNGLASFGMIVYGPQKTAVPPTGSYGYVVMISCDGQMFMERLDATRDTFNGSATYLAENFFWWTPEDLIQRGPNKTNKLGVRIIDGEITLLINGYEAITMFDDTYNNGRLGVFVYNGEMPTFTYTITSWRTWRISE